ncbi:MAG: Hsp20/alpha crystallin family protein [Thermodesulfobacteriota bacterium]
MEYIKIRLTDDFDELESRLDKTISDLFHSMRPGFSFSKAAWKPQLDVYETAEKIYIIAEIAGVDKEDLELEINPRAVRIFGRRAGAPPADNGKYRLAEIQYGPFERVLYLRTPVDTEKVTAKYKNGFLYIDLNKIPHAQKQKIPINIE